MKNNWKQFHKHDNEEGKAVEATYKMSKRKKERDLARNKLFHSRPTFQKGKESDTKIVVNQGR